MAKPFEVFVFCEHKGLPIRILLQGQPDNNDVDKAVAKLPKLLTDLRRIIETHETAFREMLPPSSPEKPN